MNATIFGAGTVWVTAWSNGAPSRCGAGYGLRVAQLDRDRCFRPEWAWVDVELAGSGVMTTVRLSASFWRGCSELRSAAIGRWLVDRGLAPWPTGSPPRLALCPLGWARFRLLPDR